jgi:iron(III) transport system ATP-binding protein
VTAETVIRLNNVTKSYNHVTAVDDLSLTVDRCSLLGLLGGSGCGKTTTLRLIAGLERPDRGEIWVNNQLVAGANQWVVPEQRRIGMVFQDYALFPHLTVGDNIAFGLRGSKTDKAGAIADILTLVGLPGAEKRMPYELSGGQQQRVALARALAPQPDIVLLDEPFSNLDAALRAQVRSEVRAILKQANATCIFVTHDQEEALSLSDRVAVMFDGRIVQVAPPRELYLHPANREVAAFVGESNFLPGTADGTTADTPVGRLPLKRSAVGAVTVLIRPEMIRLGDTGTIYGRVVWQEFYGHDQRIGLTLDDGTNIVARADSAQFVEQGQTIGMTVDGVVSSFAREV